MSKIVTVGVLLMVGIVGIKFIGSWYGYLQLKGAMQESVKQAHVSSETTVISAVLAKAKQLNIPLAPGDIHLEQYGQGSVRLWAEYDVTFTFPLGFFHRHTFRPEVTSAR